MLVLRGEHNILAAPANDILSDPVELYYTEHNITGKTPLCIIIPFNCSKKFCPSIRHLLAVQS